LKRVLKGVLICGAVISFSASSWSAYWLYQNNNYQLSRIAQPLKDAKIVKPGEGEKFAGAEYSPSVEVTSAEQLEKARKDTSKPLYLRNLLSVPNLGINLQVFEGTSERSLTYGAGTIKADQDPDKIGNYALAAHNFYDSSYGSGFSILQDAAPSTIKGSYAYLSDGDYVYTYKLVEVTEVYKDDSMVYTEDDFSEQVFQDYLKESPSGLKEIVKSNKVWNSDGTYLEDPDGKQFTYGKLLTLYTCKLEPYNRTLSYNRILVTGVQLKKERLDQAPKDVQKLFLDESGNLNVTGNSEVPKSESEASNTNKDNESSGQKDQNKPLEFKKIDSDEMNWSDPLSFFVNKQIKKDPDFMMKFFWGSFVLTGITSLLSIYLPGKNDNKIDKKKQIEDGSEVYKILKRRGK
jgi:sortase